LAKLDRNYFFPVHNGDMSADVVKFGDNLELDRIAYELRRSGQALKLERIPMEILLLLLARRGQLLSREEIIDQIWGRDVFLDTDNSINSAIRKIRQVLKDDPENPAYIQTVTGKGYRFIAVVAEAGVPETSQTAPANPGDESHPVESGGVNSLPAARSSAKMSGAAALLALIVLLAGGVYIARMRSNSGKATHRVMLAVLPFANLSDDREQEYFSFCHRV